MHGGVFFSALKPSAVRPTLGVYLDPRQYRNRPRSKETSRFHIYCFSFGTMRTVVEVAISREANHAVEAARRARLWKNT